MTKKSLEEILQGIFQGMKVNYSGLAAFLKILWASAETF